MAGVHKRGRYQTNTQNHSNGISPSNQDQSDSTDYVVLPKHIPFPDIERQSDLMVELIMFGFSLLATLTQIVHLYRTVWWLPDSYTHQALNFHLINPFLFSFIEIILGRRLLFCLIEMGLSKLKLNKAQYQNYIQYTFVILITGVLYYLYRRMIEKNDVLVILYLIYPLLVYILFFGADLGPLLREPSESVFPYMNGVPMHGCTSNSSYIRDEAHIMNTDFNRRLKQVLFTSTTNAYYAGFIPYCLAPSYLQYSIYWVNQHVIFIWIGSFMMCWIYSFPTKYLDMLHRCALHLGQWIQSDSFDEEQISEWCDNSMWYSGGFCSYNGDTYKADGPTIAAVPGDRTHRRFYKFFRNPPDIFFNLTLVQGAIVIMQLSLLLFSVIEWHHVISLSFLILTNHHTLMRIHRDYLVTLRVYSAEEAIYQKLRLDPLLEG